MLVLTRKRNESIKIGDDIVITIVRIKSNGDVRVGIEAPPNVNIVRTELLEGEDESGS